MDFYKNYRLVEDGDGFTLELYLNPGTEEFASEFLAGAKETTIKVEEQIKKLIREKFSDVKINSVKLMLGTMVVGTLSLFPVAATNAAAATPAKTSSVASLNTTATVTATSLNMRTGASTAYPIMHVLWKGNVVKIIGESNGWYQIKLTDGRTGWSSGQYLKLNNQQTTRQEKVDALIAYSKTFLGTPYVYGGDSPSDGGFDCSGFTQYVFGKHGYTLNRISKDQASNGTFVAKANLQPGDLVFYSFEGNGVISHVGIYLGGGKMIHSPKTGDTVKITDTTTSYWTSRYVTARRIIQ
ncbi:C40 family peptidase [Ruminiclostridium josui]|uniref:C40 family peptidase n=1 Tax=Ruminiclostridium josui TaxID=1499 RepID=UPI000464ED39|nr:SH3 domain-containing C40 family peptidase [Ruminiclostridium josui]